MAPPEATPAFAPTGIGYLGLLATRRDAELASAINCAQLACGCGCPEVPYPHDTADTEPDNKENQR